MATPGAQSCNNLAELAQPGAIVGVTFHCVHVGNAFDKLAGSTQVAELGEIETPILLTSTLNVPRVGNASRSPGGSGARQGHGRSTRPAGGYLGAPSGGAAHA